MSDAAGEKSLFEDIFPFTEKPVNGQNIIPPDIHSIDRAAYLIGQAFNIAEEMSNDGITTGAIAREINEFLTDSGADPGIIIGTSIEATAWHGRPGDVELHNGEIFTLDIACSYRGWWADSARTIPVGDIDEKRKKLIRCAWESTVCAAGYITEGFDGEGVGEALEAICHRYGMSLAGEGAGHGIGTRLHEAPSLTYDGRLHEKLRSGCIYTAEPVICSGKGTVLISSDGEGISSDGEPTAHFEVSVLCLPHGNHVLGAPEWFLQKPC